MYRAPPYHLSLGKAVFFLVAVLVFLGTIKSRAEVVNPGIEIYTPMGSLYKQVEVGGHLEGDLCVQCHFHHRSGAQLRPLWSERPTMTDYNLWGLNLPAAVNFQPVSVSSALCLSCHDGTLAMNIVGDLSGSACGIDIHRLGAKNARLREGANENLAAAEPMVPAPARNRRGIDLRNSHPVSVAYNNYANRGLRPAAAVQASGVKLYNGKVECASCHNPHELNNESFLRKSNRGSKLCLTCHVK